MQIKILSISKTVTYMNIISLAGIVGTVLTQLCTD